MGNASAGHADYPADVFVSANKAIAMRRTVVFSLKVLQSRYRVAIFLFCVFVGLPSTGRAQFQRRSIEAEDSYSYGGRGAVEEGETPLPDVFVTANAYVDRSLEFNYGGFNNLDDGQADQDEFSFGLNYALTNRFAFSIEAPYLYRDPVQESNTSGFGDLELGVQYILFGYVEDRKDGGSYGSGAAISGGASGFARRTIEGESGGSRRAYGADGAEAPPFVLSVGLDIAAPTGDVSRELGDGFTSLAPQMLFYWQLNEIGSALRGQFGLEIPTVSDETTAFFYNIAFSQIFLGTQDWRRLNTLVGVVEFNGLSGDQGTLYVTPGVRWYLTQFDLIGVAGSFPVTESREFDSQILVSYIHELPERSSSRRRR